MEKFQRYGGGELLTTSVRDGEGQCEYGYPKDVAVATVVTTADLAALIPMPDDATFLRATKESLLKCEEQVAALQAYLQRELTFELQDAGVGFGPSLLDDLNDQAAVERRRLRSDRPHRRQLQFKSRTNGRNQAAEELQAADNTVGFAVHSQRYALYPSRATVSAQALGESLESAEARHKLFDDMIDNLMHHGTDDEAPHPLHAR